MLIVRSPWSGTSWRGAHRCRRDVRPGPDRPAPVPPVPPGGGRPLL